MGEFLRDLNEPLRYHLFTFGGANFTVGSLVRELIAILALVWISRWLRSLLVGKLLARGHLDVSTRETVSALTQYLVWALGLIVILDSSGVKLSSFTVLAGALGVGVGFGLQTIFSNLISGLIVMFERPVKIGDHVVVAGMEGNVVRIGMRATTLITPQGSLVIIPNQNFITGIVTNWDQAGLSASVLQWRMMGKIEEDEALLLRIARDNPDVLNNPEPTVYVTAADHAGHLMELHVRLPGDVQGRLRCISALNRSLLENLARLGQNLAANP